MKFSSLHLCAKPPGTAANLVSAQLGPFISVHLLAQLRGSQLLEKHLPQAWHSAMVFRKNDVSLTFRNGKRKKNTLKRSTWYIIQAWKNPCAASS